MGQKVTKRILQNSITMERVPNAICFSGLHGCGKTTLARIYAKALNCPEVVEGSPCCKCASCLDIDDGKCVGVVEKDAASNNGVDDVRQIQEDLTYVSEQKRRVVILDEAQQLSKSAQAALLKLVEEPPKNTTFLLVTTEPEKLETTLRSRCMNLHCTALTPADMEASIRYILKVEEVEATDIFVQTLSRNGGGSLRDMQQILDQVLSFRGPGQEVLDEDMLTDFMGVISSNLYKDLAYALNCGDFVAFHEIIEEWHSSGIDLEHLYMVGVPNMLRDLLVCASGAYTEGVYYYSGINHETLVKNIRLTQPQVTYISSLWDTTLESMKHTSYPKVVWEIFAAKVCHGQLST